ncbi:MAG: hypothetical protein JJD98_18725 [Polaromonas sp.]|nr:hypothetical protein [Polaromonas sp.]
MIYKQNPRDEQAPKTRKVENDTNKLGEQERTRDSSANRRSSLQNRFSSISKHHHVKTL